MNNIYSDKEWDDYSAAFQSVMPSMMLEVNRAVADQMEGDVIDFGCGAAKIAPFVLENQKVTSYTGIDSAPLMVEHAQWMLAQFPEKPGRVLQARVEEVRLEEHDSALSINSFYAWGDPALALDCIQRSLRRGGGFVLVTPNPRIDMPALLEASHKEMIAHPHWETFRAQNLAFCSNPAARFVTMDALVELVRRAGFLIVEAHQRFYQGGLNFLQLRKRSFS